MKPKKAYIIRISDTFSQKYANVAAKSCSDLGIDYEFFKGVENKTAYEAWTQSGLNTRMIGVYKTHKIDKAACATVSHALLWKKISEGAEAAIILEHDAVMLHPLDIQIPDDRIVVLGYKLKDISRYDYIKAGPPNSIIDIPAHEGAHAYAITPACAGMMLKELETIGNSLPVDNAFFLKSRSSKIPLAILNPTPAIGWLRTSTIWDKSSDLNYEFIDTFKQHLLD